MYLRLMLSTIVLLAVAANQPGLAKDGHAQHSGRASATNNGASGKGASGASPPAAKASVPIDAEATVAPPDLAVRADRRALSQILLNLTNNAIKFTERGRVSLLVGERQEAGRKVIEFRVSDTGIGIRAEDQARLFQAFKQVDAPRKQRQEGTGLGLHLSRKLAELLGGQITLQSEHGKGSTFTLVLAEA